jgi:hypothetical protein
MSVERMTIHDKRLQGNPPPISQNTFQVDENWKIVNAFAWVSSYAKSKNGLDVLYIMCHGLYVYEENDQVQASGPIGGYGLQLCSEGLTVNNVAAVGKMIEGLIDNIVIFACGAASDQSSSLINGQYLCANLAVKSKATVYAADRKQWYNPGSTSGGSADVPLDFGAWEGTVYSFTPDGIVRPIEKNSSPSYN